MMTIDGTSGVTFPNSTVQAQARPDSPQSMVRVNTANGYGSTNTAIRRFSTVVTNQGSDITYADSATLGASFTINTSGVYAISYSDSFGAAANWAGISKNSSQLTTAINLINAADALAVAYSSGSGVGVNVSATVYLAAGDVIRAHTGAVAYVAGAQTLFNITRVA